MVGLAKSRDVVVPLVASACTDDIGYKLWQCFQCLDPCPATICSFVPDSSFEMSLDDPCGVPAGCVINVYYEPLLKYPIRGHLPLQSAGVGDADTASVQP